MSKNNPKLTDISVILLGVAAVAVIVVFSFVDVTLSQIPQINELAKDVIQRALLSLFLVVLCATSQYKTLLNFPVDNLGKQLLALLPCLAVALANFPFSALIKGTATLQNFQYVWLFFDTMRADRRGGRVVFPRYRAGHCLAKNGKNVVFVANGDMRGSILAVAPCQLAVRARFRHDDVASRVHLSYRGNAYHTAPCYKQHLVVRGGTCVV